MFSSGFSSWDHGDDGWWVRGATAAIEAVPSAKYAGQTLPGTLLRIAVGDTPIPLDKSLPALQRLAEIDKEKRILEHIPNGITQLLNRSQSPIPMVYPEARDFASSMSALSGAQKLEATPRVLAEMGNLRSGIHGDIADAIGEYIF